MLRCIILLSAFISLVWCDNVSEPWCNNGTKSPDPIDCRGYLLCVDGFVTYEKCPEKEIYDDSVKDCVPEKCSECYCPEENLSPEAAEATEGFETSETTFPSEAAETTETTETIEIIEATKPNETAETTKATETTEETETTPTTTIEITATSTTRIEESTTPSRESSTIPEILPSTESEALGSTSSSFSASPISETTTTETTTTETTSTTETTTTETTSRTETKPSTTEIPPPGVNCGLISRPHGGYIRDPNRCNLFWVCVWGRPIKLRCPGNLWFDTKRNLCNYARYVRDCPENQH